MKPAKILVIKLRAIGDVVLSTAVLPNLKAAYPDARIHFLTERPSSPVVEENPDTDRVLVLPSRSAFQSGWKYNVTMVQFLNQIRQQKYDLVFDLFGNPRSALITWLSGSPNRVGYRFRGRVLAYNKRIEPRGDRVHEVEFNLDALRGMGIPVGEIHPQFYFRSEHVQKIESWLQDALPSCEFLIAMHPWGSWKAKRWPLSSFAELATRLIRFLNARVVVLWGPGEKEVAKEVCALSEEELTLAPSTTLMELGALLSRCDLVIANDSGPMHIAAAVGTPTIGLFGPTNPDLQGPYGPKGLAVYNQAVSCIGCNRLECPDGRCMTDLGVNQVESEIMAFLSNINIRQPSKMEAS